MIKMSAMALTAAMIIAPLSAIAVEEKKPSTFEQLDLNSDGKISVTEAKDTAPLMQQFEQLDVNKDGYLSEAEFSLLQIKSETYAQVFTKSHLFTL